LRELAGNNKFLKKLNKESLLDLIRLNGAISKVALSQLTGLSPTATGMIVSQLLEDGYIHETGIGESSGGRKPILLELKPHSFYSIGIDIDIDVINLVLIDITGEVIFEKECKRLDNSKPEATMQFIENEILEVLKKYSIDFNKLLGIGISIPGLVDEVKGEIILAPNLFWENVMANIYFKKLADIPLYVENEAMASAVCEHWVGQCQGIDDFLCINIKSGIGAGIFTGGKLYRGVGGSAGEIGHTFVYENGPKCGCGNYGCLETLASTKSIVENAKKIVRQGIISSMNDYEDIDAISIEEVIAAARAGDEAAKNILLESARYLSLAIANIVNTLNPAKIVIGKEFVKYSDLVMDNINAIVAGKALKYPASKVEIMVSKIGERSSTVGAALIPLKVLFGK
jgi:N-acetylglucosamine repressor